MTPSHLNREDVMLSCSKENSDPIATLVRKPAERDAAEQKPRTAEFFPANQENSQ